jgi:hypothetical protein
MTNHSAALGSVTPLRQHGWVCHFCHAQLFEITHAENIKSPLEQPSRQNAKVVQAFCDALPPADPMPGPPTVP